MKLVWYDPNAENPPWIKALADVRRMGTLEGYCFHHVQAIMLAIDQYAKTALGNREYFLNKPYGIGGEKKTNPYGAKQNNGGPKTGPPRPPFSNSLDAPYSTAC